MKSCPTCRRRFIDLQELCPLDASVLGAGDGETDAGLGRVLGSYRLICVLGEGGMGKIYIGAHTRLNRHVAIKVLRAELQNKKENITRFFDEARTVNRIKHPNIVESIDLVEDVIDGAYCVLELLHGPDLKARLRQGRLPVASAIHIGAQIADALAAVHSIDIVHRDLKPENLILIERDGRDDFVKLIDFGVAQISDEHAGGVPFGTAAYMAPEQAAGGRVDGRADVYSLGVLLYEMTTGQHPFPSNSDHEYLVRHADSPVPRPSKLVREMPRRLESVIMRCLAKAPGDRFPTAAAVAVALRALDTRSPGRGKAGWILLGLGLAGAGAAAVVLVPRYLTDETSAHAAAAEPPAHVAPTAVATPAAAAPPAPAPPPPPAAPPAPAAPAEITISFTTTPAGAQVFREGETVPLGTTPFDAAFVPSAHPVRIRIELTGYEPAATELALETSHEVAVALERTPAAVAPVRPRKVDKRTKPTAPVVKPLQREGTIDPFAPTN